jgi:hypothetical protein
VSRRPTFAAPITPCALTPDASFTTSDLMMLPSRPLDQRAVAVGEHRPRPGAEPRRARPAM